MTAVLAPRRERAGRVDAVAWALGGVFLACAIWFVLATSVGWTHSLSDAHGFRQSQTALTTYYLLKGGPLLRYETPVLGAPWSIPFEFPLFQWLVARAARLTGMPLPAAGRLVSEVFFLATLLALVSLLGRFHVRPVHRLVFVALLLVSPEYVFWSRAFMIESTALCFSVVYLDLTLRHGETGKPATAVLACLVGALAGLVKVTTFAVFLAMAAIWFAWATGRAWRGAGLSRELVRRAALPALLCFALPVLAVAGWTHFADAVKRENILGLRLTSEMLRPFNFGTLAMRFQADTWRVLLTRTVPDVAGHLAPCLLAGVAVWWTGRRRALYLLSILGFLGGILIFTNLHVVHDYYAYATGIFLVAAVAWGVVSLLEGPGPWSRAAALALLGVALTVSVHQYYRRFYPIQATNHTGMPRLAAAVAGVTAPDAVVLGYGLTWSSELPFYAERRALIWPPWMDQGLGGPDFQRALRDTGVDRIGSLVLCAYRPDQDIPGVSERYRPGPDPERWLAEITRRLGLDPRPTHADEHCAVFARGNVGSTGSP
jgi:hypothetical protein